MWTCLWQVNQKPKEGDGETKEKVWLQWKRQSKEKNENNVQ